MKLFIFLSYLVFCAPFPDVQALMPDPSVPEIQELDAAGTELPPSFQDLNPKDPAQEKGGYGNDEKGNRLYETKGDASAESDAIHGDETNVDALAGSDVLHGDVVSKLTSGESVTGGANNAGGVTGDKLLLLYNADKNYNEGNMNSLSGYTQGVNSNQNHIDGVNANGNDIEDVNANENGIQDVDANGNDIEDVNANANNIENENVAKADRNNMADASPNMMNLHQDADKNYYYNQDVLSSEDLEGSVLAQQNGNFRMKHASHVQKNQRQKPKSHTEHSSHLYNDPKPKIDTEHSSHLQNDQKSKIVTEHAPVYVQGEPKSNFTKPASTGSSLTKTAVKKSIGENVNCLEGSLLHTSGYRVLLALIACFALFGNVGSLLYRALVKTREAGHSCGVLVSHLCFSDLLMGVYLLILGAADGFYGNSYGQHGQDWMSSSACRVAGVLSLLSSEVSVFLICLLTLDRLLTLHCPHLGLSVRPVSARLLCCMAWAVGIFLAVVPLIQSHWKFYGSASTCLPLPTTSEAFEGKDYSFGVLIMLNFALFFFIALGQALVYFSLRSRRKKLGGCSEREEVDAAVTRRLLAIAVTDFLCWFPICLVGFLASNGLAIPNEVNTALSIVVLPVNAAVNPFIYTLPLTWPNVRHVFRAVLAGRRQGHCQGQGRQGHCTDDGKSADRSEGAEFVI